MAGTGTHALLRRVLNIMRELRESGEADGEFGSAKHTLAVIDQEAALQLARYNNLMPNHRKADTTNSAFGNQLSYLHNEFNFDVAFPLGGIALVTHISFIPIYPPKHVEGSDDAPRLKTIRAESVSASLVHRVRRLRAKAIHVPDGHYGDESFRGGKDDIAKKIGRFLSYDQPVITTMRSIDRLNEFVHGHFLASDDAEVSSAAARATAWNERLDEEVTRHGMSSRLSMLREYMLRLSPSESSQMRLTWVRHRSHYQTLTAFEHADPTRAHPKSGFDPVDRAVVPTLSALADDIARRAARSALVDRTALDAFPDKWAEFLFGRYLQGANYLLLPAALLFDKAHLAQCEAFEAPNVPAQEPWHELCDRVLRMCDVPHQFGHQVHLSVEQFTELWQKARTDPTKLRPASELALRLLRPLIDVLFANAGDKQFEFVMYGAAEGAAIVLSDVRNFGTPGHRPLMSATIIIDLAMNEFERGRFLKHLTELSTQRFLSLYTIGPFQFFNYALDVLSEDLSRATHAWVDEATGEGAPTDSDKDDTFIKALQNLTTNLTLLNSFVNGGVVAQAKAVEASRDSVLSHVEGIGHYPLPGFLSMIEFLNRRFFKSIQTISSVGQRYQLLRERVSQLSALVEAKLQIAQEKQQTTQAESQSSLLSKVDRLTLFGIVYYAGQILTYALVGLVLLGKLGWSKYWGIEQHLDVRESEEPLKDVLYLLLLCGGLMIGYRITIELAKELLKSPTMQLMPKIILFLLMAALIALAFFTLRALLWSV